MKKALKVLIIDDSDSDRSLYKRALKKIDMSLTVTFAITGEEGKDKFDELLPDITFLDYRLPDLTGINWLEDKKDNLELYPIVMLTGEGSESIATKAIQLGAYDYLPKENINSESLEIIIRNALERRTLKLKLEKNRTTMEYMAFHDPLTSLANRAKFEQSLNATVSKSKRFDRRMAVFLLDLDGFKVINDSLGHNVGDQLLKLVSTRLSKIPRETDLLSRVGGDEFALIVDELQRPEDAAVIAKKIIVSLTKEFLLADQNLRVTASIGIACYPESGTAVVDLMKNADLALYGAKAQGKNNFMYFTKELNKKVQEELAIEKNIDKGLEKHEFSLEYQPIYNLNTGELFGFEALCRWSSDELGSVEPLKFIPIAEQKDCIERLGAWICQQALQDFSDWYKKNKMLKLAINISPKQILTDKWANEIYQDTLNYNIPAQNIIFELTETSLINDLDLVKGSLCQLRELGFGIHVDDFGTGYSSLSLINELSVSGLKIDKSFIDDINSDELSGRMVKSIIALAKIHELTFISEGVSNEEQCEFLKRHDGSLVQGFYLSKPLKKAAVDKLLKKS